jgi:hypothetical protein
MTPSLVLDPLCQMAAVVVATYSLCQMAAVVGATTTMSASLLQPLWRGCLPQRGHLQPTATKRWSTKVRQRYTEKANEIGFVCPISFNLALISHHILFWQGHPPGRMVLRMPDVG